MVAGQRRAADEIRDLPPEISIGLIGTRGISQGVVLHDAPGVADKRTVPHLERIAWNADDALHVIPAQVQRKNEDDDVAAARLVQRRKLPGNARNAGSVN